MKYPRVGKKTATLLVTILMLLGSHPAVGTEQRSSTDPVHGGSGQYAATKAGSDASGILSLLSYMLVMFITLNPCVHGTGSSPSCDHPILGPIGQDPTITDFNIMFLKMFVPWFILIFILLGIYLIFMQGSPSGRAEAKSMFINMVVGMILVSFSPMIFQVILDISAALSWEMFNIVSDPSSLSHWHSGSGFSLCMNCCLTLLFAVVVTLAAVIALIRYLVVVICAIIWPLALFLHSFSYTKGLGNALMKYSFIAVFSQILQIFFLIIALSVTSGTPGIENMFIMVAGLVMVIISPLILTKILGWIGGVVWLYSTRGSPAFTRFLGATMMGYRPADALVIASSRWHVRQMGGPHGPLGSRLPMWMQTFSGADETGAGKVIGEDYDRGAVDMRAKRQPGAGGGFFGATGASLKPSAGSGGVGGAQAGGIGATERAGGSLDKVTPYGPSTIPPLSQAGGSTETVGMTGGGRTAASPPRVVGARGYFGPTRPLAGGGTRRPPPGVEVAAPPKGDAAAGQPPEAGSPEGGELPAAGASPSPPPDDEGMKAVLDPREAGARAKTRSLEEELREAQAETGVGGAPAPAEGVAPRRHRPPPMPPPAAPPKPPPASTLAREFAEVRGEEETPRVTIGGKNARSPEAWEGKQAPAPTRPQEKTGGPPAAAPEPELPEDEEPIELETAPKKPETRPPKRAKEVPPPKPAGAPPPAPAAKAPRPPKPAGAVKPSPAPEELTPAEPEETPPTPTAAPQPEEASRADDLSKIVGGRMGTKVAQLFKRYGFGDHEADTIAELRNRGVSGRKILETMRASGGRGQALDHLLKEAKAKEGGSGKPDSSRRKRK